MARKLKIGIIGSGGIAQSCHIPGYLSVPDQCEVVALCDSYEPNLTQAAEKFGITETYSDYREMLKNAEIDAVSVATPNALHLRPTVEALRSGKHVLCEKPLGMNAIECREMCRTARETGKILQVALQYRFMGPSQFLKAYIDSGKMGDIYYARAQALRRRGVPSWGVFIDKEKQGGGPLIDIGVHILDLTLFLMGYPKPVSACGQTWNHLGTNPELCNPWGDYDRSKFTVEDFAVGFVRFENGAVIVLESSFMGNMTGNPFGAQLFGTKAGATIFPNEEDSIRIFTEENKQLFDVTPKNIPNVQSAHTVEVQKFIDAILNDKPSPVPGENGLILNAIFDAIYKSCETGKEEAIDVSY